MFRPAADEAVLQRYYTSGGGIGTEVLSQVYGSSLCASTGNFYTGLTFSPPMREAPTGATSTLTAGGLLIETAATMTAVGTLSVTAASAYGVTIKNTAACTATLPYILVGGNTTGLILFSAEP